MDSAMVGISVRCPCCGHFLTEVWGATATLRIICPSRRCHRQSWYVFFRGALVESGTGAMPVAAALEKAAGSV